MSVDEAERVVLLRPGVDDDGDLVAEACSGDVRAFGELYRRYRRMVHGVLLASVPALEVGDLVQDVFTRAWAGIQDLRNAESFGSWLAAIARRRAADFHRERHAVARAPARLTQSPLFAEGLALLEAIRILPQAYRETLVLRFVEGMTGPEIAERTGLTHRSVRVNLHRGVKLLRAQLADQEVG